MSTTSTDPLDTLVGRRGHQGVPAEYPGAIWQRVLRSELATLDRQPQGPSAHLEGGGRLGQIHPSLRDSPVAIVAGDSMMAPQGRDAFLRPAIAPSRPQPMAVEHPGDHRVRADLSPDTHCRDDL